MKPWHEAAAEAAPKGCCSPGGAGGDGTLPDTVRAGAASDGLRRAVEATLVDIPGGFFMMGARQPIYPADHEGPARRVRVSPFRIARTAVTNALFARFVDETGYRTLAEREGWSYVFHGFLKRPAEHPASPPGTPWWRQVFGADWRAPEGPGSTIAGREDHPVVHASWFDAAAFCRHLGLRLPTEAEWERAARGGLAGKLFPWGNRLVPADGHRHNVWQGRFPELDTAEDGHAGTAPVDSFPPNGYGLHNMTGNVWEWCADRFGPPPRPRLPEHDPQGPDAGETRVLRGGSYLCHASYCERYKVHSRIGNTPDSTTGHTGFRIAAPVG